MRPAISQKKLSETLTLSECHPSADHRDPWWLYDKTQGMNLAMGAKTSEDAFVQALTYYQKRLAEVEANYKELKGRVDAFVAPFLPEDDENDY